MRLTYSKMGVHYEKSWNPQGCVDAERHPASAFCVATIRFPRWALRALSSSECAIAPSSSALFAPSSYLTH